MSGPIVRRYGFPNFEKIFGERPIEHGADEPEGGESKTDDRAKTPTGDADAGKASGPSDRSKPSTS